MAVTRKDVLDRRRCNEEVQDSSILLHLILNFLIVQILAPANDNATARDLHIS